ncbi:MAG: MATE family efflux transporter, partial [Pseudomonadota bacterium]|nr:MATE family efflux transporter [Pseudomonadota bacterium]
MRDIDLTRGPISGHFRTLAVPAAMGMLFSTLYNVVDVYFAGQISTDAQAGMAIGFQAFFIMMSMGFGIGSAMGALVGNA